MDSRGPRLTTWWSLGAYIRAEAVGVITFNSVMADAGQASRQDQDRLRVLEGLPDEYHLPPGRLS